MKEKDTPNDKTQDGLLNQDFRQKLLLLVITFILTGIVGGTLSYYFQTRTLYINNRQGLIESERKISREIFEEITNGMDARIYFAQIANNDLVLRSSNFSNKWGDYTGEMAKWNSKLNTRKELVKIYFGTTACDNFRAIHKQFVKLNSRLQQVNKIRNNPVPFKNYKADSLWKSIDVDIKKVDDQIASLSSFLISRIQNDAVGRVPTLKKYKFLDYIDE